ncbi:hypothetical protein NA57DRAFT_74063 [Rhizodiscina lignyota]|uniref:Uncharacterized protein n=1 Tax=Rhizodiscina lignyota TaxID=1504668 RepID=A0A9P4IGB0_9PEZI|nr:hypothetical protein NA57DRAFT_74063 [Rhizodiscina lignyota]
MGAAISTTLHDLPPPYSPSNTALALVPTNNERSMARNSNLPLYNPYTDRVIFRPVPLGFDQNYPTPRREYPERYYPPPPRTYDPRDDPGLYEDLEFRQRGKIGGEDIDIRITPEVRMKRRDGGYYCDDPDHESSSRRRSRRHRHRIEEDDEDFERRPRPNGGYGSSRRYDDGGRPPPRYPSSAEGYGSDSNDYGGFGDDEGDFHHPRSSRRPPRHERNSDIRRIRKDIGGLHNRVRNLENRWPGENGWDDDFGPPGPPGGMPPGPRFPPQGPPGFGGGFGTGIPPGASGGRPPGGMPGYAEEDMRYLPQQHGPGPGRLDHRGPFFGRQGGAGHPGRDYFEDDPGPDNEFMHGANGAGRHDARESGRPGGRKQTRFASDPIAPDRPQATPSPPFPHSHPPPNTSAPLERIPQPPQPTQPESTPQQEPFSQQEPFPQLSPPIPEPGRHTSPPAPRPDGESFRPEPMRDVGLMPGVFHPPPGFASFPPGPYQDNHDQRVSAYPSPHDGISILVPPVGSRPPSPRGGQEDVRMSGPGDMTGMHARAEDAPPSSPREGLPGI